MNPETKNKLTCLEIILILVIIGLVMGFVTTINDYTAQKDTEKQTDNDTQEDNNEEIKSYSPQQTELLNQINKEKKLPF